VKVEIVTSDDCWTNALCSLLVRILCCVAVSEDEIDYINLEIV